MTVHQKLAVSYRPTESLVPYAQNARTHSTEQIGQIAASIAAFGWTNPVLIDESDNIIAGHGRLLAAAQLGIGEAPCIVIAGLDDKQRRALILADNKLALNAGWDEQLLAVELEGLQDMAGLIGFSQAEVDMLLKGGTSSGDMTEEEVRITLAERFGVPPFSVLDARKGWWQERKAAWVALGIKSEVGRGSTAGGKLTMSRTVQELKPHADQALKRSKINTTPGGGSPRPSADYKKTRARGDGHGRALKG